MGDRSQIEWTDASWNPLAAFDRETGKRGWFCEKVSAGCTNCYAEALNQRLGTGHGYRAKHRDDVELRLVNLDQPIRWRRPRRIFVNSMTDLFYERVPFEMIDEVFASMVIASRHTFQVLTKRPERQAEYMQSRAELFEKEPPWAHPVQRAIDKIINERPTPEDAGLWEWPPNNVWLGTSCEDQAAADERIPHLLRTPAAVRFLSCEPLLGPVDLNAVEWETCGDCDPCIAGVGRTQCSQRYPINLLHPDGIHWIIAGGESGPGARPCDVGWIRSLVHQCRATGVPAFVKQLGARPTTDHRTRPAGEPSYWTRILKDRKGGDPDEWPADLRVREFPEVAR